MLCSLGSQGSQKGVEAGSGGDFRFKRSSDCHVENALEGVNLRASLCETGMMEIYGPPQAGCCVIIK